MIIKKENIELLVLKAKAGNTNALKEIMQRFHYFILKESSKYKIPSYDYQDIVQHGYLTIIKCINMYKKNNDSFNGYVINAIKNNYNALLRGNIKNYKEIPNDTLLDLERPGYEFTIEEQIIAYEEAEKLHKAINNLDTLEKIIIQEFYFNDKSIADISTELNISTTKLYRLKKTILNKLYNILKKDTE